MMIDEDAPVIEFNATMRCDACGSQAYTMAVREDVGAELLFCLHHRRKHSDRLLEDGWELIDDYEGLSMLTGNEPAFV